MSEEIARCRECELPLSETLRPIEEHPWQESIEKYIEIGYKYYCSRCSEVYMEVKDEPVDE